MRSTLYIKFIIVYIVFGFLSIFCVASITSEMMMNRLEENTSSKLYREASLLSNDFLPDYFTGRLEYVDIKRQLNNLQEYLSADIWMVSQTGTMLVYSSRSGKAPDTIEDFDPVENGGKLYSISTYHDYFSEEVITIITPIISEYNPDGYLLIHKPYSDLKTELNSLMNPVYITLAVILLLSFSILIAFQFLVYLPLRKITAAARMYASGNLDYEIPIYSHDEIGYLSASLNHMSSRLKDMEDYQKKFIANISHDFRSPLTSIKGYLEAMADGTIPLEMQPRYFKILLFETERLTDLTQDILTLNALDSKNLLMNYSSFDIHETIKNTVTSFEGTCRGKRISLELIFATKILNVNADKRKIQQVLYNLLDNAIKFSSYDSHIVVETTERNGKVYVSIKDNGIGIPKKALTKIWDRFYKTDLSRGKDKKGTGLGLSIVKEIIQAHNENINVISTEGVGTEFIFSLKKDK